VTDTAVERLVKLEAVHNFRDLGGYPTLDGRSTRWNRLYRADGLHRLTAADLDVLRPLGLRTVIDLRTQRELDERGQFPIGQYPVRYHHLSVIDVTWDRDDTVGDGGDDPVEFLTAQYHALLAQGQARLAEAFALLAETDALPAVFHCAVGKDRTGLLAALVLSALGVDDVTVATDYGLSREAMTRMFAWVERQGPEAKAAWQRVPASHLAAEPEALLRVLAGLRDRHGSIVDYLGSIGVERRVLLRLADELLTPSA
jgi:protein-tyrosine phosphatase